MPYIVARKQGQPDAGWIRVYENGPDSPIDPAAEERIEIPPPPDGIFDRSAKRWDWALGALRDATPEEFVSAPHEPSIWRCPQCNQIALAGGDECMYCQYRR